MIKLLFSIIKKIVVSSLVIYAYDVMSFSLGVIIPINLINVLLVSFLGFPAMFGLVLFYFII